jgi:hypothetical protein|tara:strand:- start:13 stop:243 length:231 start_codon:yes stop_codon:yes gene_type:complete
LVGQLAVYFYFLFSKKRIPAEIDLSMRIWNTKVEVKLRFLDVFSKTKITVYSTIILKVSVFKSIIIVRKNIPFSAI